MKKNKLLIILIIILIFSNKIYYKIYNIKCYYYNKRNNIDTISIIKNNFSEIIINKGKKDKVTVNMICEGENGFIGIITYVDENYSIIKTFWYMNWNLIVIDGNNNYGFLKNNGFSLYIKMNMSDNMNISNKVYIFNKNYPPSLLGEIKKINNNNYKLYPAENIFNIKKIYLKKPYDTG